MSRLDALPHRSCSVFHFVQTPLLFAARAMIMGSFTTLYIYTPEIYHTNVRLTACAIAGSFSRIGAMLAPFVGQGLIQRGHKYEAMAIFAAFTGAAAVACLFLRVETAGRTLGEGLAVAPSLLTRNPFTQLVDEKPRVD
jgi:hypothetical protein